MAYPAYPEEIAHEEAERRFGVMTLANQNGECYRDMTDGELAELEAEAGRTWTWRRTANLSNGCAQMVVRAIQREREKRRSE